jgi:WD40 repeat protein
MGEADYKYDAFLSYHSPDQNDVGEIARGLETRKLHVFFDRSSLSYGDVLAGALETGFRESKAFIYCFAQELGPWQRLEKGLAINRWAKDPSFRIVPLLLPGSGDHPLDGDLLTNFLAADFRDGGGEDKLDRLVRDIKSTEPSAPQARRDFFCPYRGLNSFREEDSAFFFGRDAAVDEIIGKLQKCPLAVVVGESGSGKSSLVRAGLIPRLRPMELAKTDWQTTLFTPRKGKPLVIELVKKWLALARPDLKSDKRNEKAEEWEEKLEQKKRGLEELASEILERFGGKRVLLVIDDLEPFFTTDPTATAKFINLLLDATTSGIFSVVLTLRADYYEEALRIKPLGDKLLTGQVNVRPMTLAERREVIVEPANRVGLKFEDGLVDRILEDLGDAPGNLPLLGYLLETLWRERGSGPLRKSAYDKVGGVTGVISSIAQKTYEKLSDPNKEQNVKKIFLGLVKMDGPVPTRDRVSMSIFDESLRSAIEQFSEQRLLVIDRDETTCEDTVELAHDSLTRNWELLSNWIAQDGPFLKGRNRLKGAVDSWKTDPYNKDVLLRGALLKEAESWLERDMPFDEDTRKFIQASTADAKKRQWVRAGTAITVFLVLAFLTGWGIQKTARFAEVQKHARARGLIARSNITRDRWDGNWQGAAALAMGAMQEERSVEADHAFRAALRLLPRERGRLNHGGPVLAAACSPDGRYLVSASSNTAFICSIEDSGAITPFALARHDTNISGIAFSPDGSKFATTGDDLRTKLWTTGTGRCITNFTDLERDSRIGFSRDGNQLAIASGNVLNMWSLTNYGLDFSNTNDSPIATMDISPDGNYLAIGAENGMVRILTIPQGSPILTTNLSPGAKVNVIRFSPDSLNFAVACTDGTVQVRATSNACPILTRVYEGGVTDVRISPHGNRLATACLDHTARILAITNGSLVGPVMLHPAEVASVLFSHDGRFLATASWDTARIWDLTLSDFPEIARMFHGSNTVEVIAFGTNNDDRLVTTSSDGTTRLWETAGWQPVRAKGSSGKSVMAIGFDRTGRKFTTLAGNSVIQLWDVLSGNEITNYSFANLQIDSLTLGPSGEPITGSGKRFYSWDSPRQPVAGDRLEDDIKTLTGSRGNLLAAGCAHGSLVLYSNFTRFLSFQHTTTVSAVAFSLDEKLLAVGCAKSAAWLWNLATTQSLCLQHTGGVNAVCFSPDNGKFATASWERRIRIWDVQQSFPLPRLRETGSLDFEGEIPYALAFSPDGKFIAAGGGSGFVFIWDVQQNEQIARLDHDKQINALAFSPNGRFLGTACDDGFARLWIWDPNLLLDEANGRLNDIPQALRQHFPGSFIANKR